MRSQYLTMRAPLLFGSQYAGPIDDLYNNLHQTFQPYFGGGWAKAGISQRYIQPIHNAGTTVKEWYDALRAS